MPDMSNLRNENAEETVNLIPLDQAPHWVLPMVARFPVCQVS